MGNLARRISRDADRDLDTERLKRAKKRVTDDTKIMSKLNNRAATVEKARIRTKSKVKLAKKYQRRSKKAFTQAIKHAARTNAIVKKDKNLVAKLQRNAKGAKIKAKMAKMDAKSFAKSSAKSKTKKASKLRKIARKKLR